MTDSIRKLAELVSKEPAWFKDCQLGAPGKGSKLGKPLVNLKNVLLALRRDPMFRGMFAFDLMECSAILRKPVAPDPPATFQPRPVTDVDIGHLQERLQVWFPRLGKDITCQALDIVAHEHAVHPIRSYLDSLRWDGKPRVRTWLEDYLGVAKSEYARGVGVMVLVSMIARVRKPGCKADSMLILEGEQGTLKSSACEALAGEWFSDALPDIGTKDCSQHLAGKWVVEFSEMVVASRADAAKFKAFASRTTERYRRPYDRKEVHEPRQVIFIGTTNLLDSYLRDETGARRFLPVRVGVIKIDALRADRDQLLAEADQMFRDGAKWWCDADFEKTHVVPEQDARYEDDVWSDAVETFVEDKVDVTITEIAVGAVGLESLQRIGTADQWRIRKILRRLGWVQGRRQANRRPWVRKS